MLTLLCSNEKWVLRKSREEIQCKNNITSFVHVFIQG